jgi:hypothetical protein
MGTGIVDNLKFALFCIPTLTYRGPLQYYTLEPIEDILANQHDGADLEAALRRFRDRKNRELDFVKQAVSPSWSKQCAPSSMLPADYSLLIP